MKPQASKDGVRMLAPFELSVSELSVSKLSIWDFALAWYEVPGVQEDCLVAQDRYGLDVTALIFALYRARVGQGFDPGTASELARTLSGRVVEPLRAARIAMKSLPRLVDPVASEALRQHIKVAELEAERLTLTALLTLPVLSEAPSLEEAIIAIADASQVALVPELAALLKRLAIAAQNM
jgi:uncharacterized protein (TIGR02444 family)